MNSPTIVSSGCAALLALTITGCTAKLDQAQEEKIVAEWRAGRIERLTSPTGWLTLVGLYWLREGDNTFGRSEHNSLILDHPAMPDTLGTFALGDGQVTFTATSASTVTLDGEPVQSIEMAPDSSGKATTLTADSVQFFVVERAGQLGVRVRDTEHPARKNFKGIEYFPVNVEWALDAKFEPYDPPRTIEILNIVGQTEKMISPGALTFRKDGKTHRLDAVLETPDDDELFIIFADETSARETYGAGRYLYIPLPQNGLGKNGRTTLDFNKAYNPPCVFNDFATCPLPPRQNRLALRVEAGEKKYVAE